MTPEQAQFQVIRVTWSSDFLITSDSYNNDKELDLPSHHHVLYQIYGFSPIYGKDSLLYIGITKDSVRRIKQHLKAVFGRGLDLKLRLGQIDWADKEDAALLEVTESILINLHKPSYNSEYLHGLYTKALDAPYMILNHGNRGSLTLECSNIWWREQIGKQNF